MNPTKLIRSAAASGLSLTAKSLSLAAKAAGAVARVAGVDEPKDQADTERPDEAVVTTDAGAAQTATTDVADTPSEHVAPDSDEALERRGRVVEPAVVAVPDAPSHVRTHETHAAELAAKPAADVVAAVGELSTDELRQLLEEEQRGKKRKSVLAAIERALLPPVSTEQLARAGAGAPASEAGGVPTSGRASGPAPRARV